MKISVVVPAYNEEKCLPETLARVNAALADAGCPSELLVVDNASEDGTRAVAESLGARVCAESVHNISRVRNTGARHARGDVLVFVDADTLVPRALFRRIAEASADARCFGGAVAVGYAPARRRWVNFYLLGWRFWGRFFNMKQGAAQFCRKSVFEELGGYDETIYMGEDVEFYWRLSKFARLRGGRLHFVESPPVTTSSRRFDRMSLWRTLLLTHPVFIRLAWRKKSFWKDWYERAVR